MLPSNYVRMSFVIRLYLDHRKFEEKHERKLKIRKS